MDQVNIILSDLLDKAKLVAERSYSPYSKRKEGVIALLEDGSMVPGVRVENASFQLTITALLNAVTTLYSLQRKDISAFVSNVPFTESELAYTSLLSGFHWELVAANVLMVAGAHFPEPGSFIEIGQKISSNPVAVQEGLIAARDAAQRAFIPESDFPVGCAIYTEDGSVITGANVEHSDWSQILCAERNALSTAISYGLRDLRDIYVACPKLPGGTPCGACRQVIVELAPQATVWMDAGIASPVAMKATDLLPGHFTGDVLRRT
ncbi:MAG: cytidine deaminase [Bacteroidetes bacterium]|nr:cytidine deaminase [Bacteroidota bacterium]